MNVLVYSGPEVLQLSLASTLSALRTLLLSHYTVQAITSKSLASDPWPKSCALLVFPGCNSQPQLRTSATRIKSYVEGGGAFLGLSAGAGLSSKVDRDRLHFYHARSGLHLSPTFHACDVAASSVEIELNNGQRTLVQDYGARSLSGIKQGKGDDTLAHYLDGDGKAIAAVKITIGEGSVLLWTPSPEHMITQQDSAAIYQNDIIKFTLRHLGLQLPSSSELNTTPHHPLPQYLASQPTKPFIVSKIADALRIPPPSNFIFRDSNDVFEFHKLGEVFDTTTTTDPETWNPKHVILCDNGTLPSRDQTPSFDIALFFDILSQAKGKQNLVDPQTHPWGMGDALFYSEVVTSTQTMLDRNPSFLSLLPSPVLSIASHQLSGRGRGANTWLSPSGCLQFSLRLLVTLSQIPANKLVFVQYLFVLGVVNGIKEILGERIGEKVRIKWPNDLYIVDFEGEKRKIGGVLVNTNFTGRTVDVIIGCGLNINTPPPIPSLASLHVPDNLLSTERIAASIIACFEPMWTEYLAGGGSFDPFMGKYLSAWLHSDQLVTLTTTTPPTTVRIVGITSDYGLLRTLPESGGGGHFIDLQPDGNSFDLMAGMISTKKSV